MATRGRNDLLRHRALPSILSQSRLPDRLLVVVDQSKEELPDSALAEFAKSLQAQCGGLVHVRVLRNRRTPQRVAAAWNTGIDQLHRDARLAARADLCYVAVLDDDDAWEPDHLDVCLEAAVARNLSMVAAGITRHDSPEDVGLRHAVPNQLDEREQFIRGQHVQGSNLFVRLDAMLLVGLFDEHLPSCTDRDLCIRLARLPELRFGGVQRHTVHHYADARTDRLSAPGSSAKLDGLTRFWNKHADRFDASARAEAAARAKELFGWTLPALIENAVEVPVLGVPAERVSLVVGCVTDAEPPEHVRGLLEDLLDLTSNAGVAALNVVVVENGPIPTSGERPLHVLAGQYQQRGLDIRVVTLERQREDWTQGRLVDTPDPIRNRLKIAVSRTVLNTYVAQAAAERTGAWAWVLDDDKRLHIRVDRGDGSIVERRSPDLAALLDLKNKGINIVLGPDTDAAPLPFAATLRVQLLDLEHLLGVMRTLAPKDPWPDRSARDHASRILLHDSYYDLSKLTEHLETPFTLPPATLGCSAENTLETVALKVGRLLAGEAVFRPLSVEASALSIDSAIDSVQRGGSTIFFNPGVLLEYPQNMARFGERYVRRSDMLVAQLMRDQRGLKIVMHPAAGVKHDRSGTRRAMLDDETLWEDVLGYALYRAVNELLGSRTEAQKRQPLLAWTRSELEEASRLVRKYVEERLAALTLNGWRIFGLADAVKRGAAKLVDHPSWSDEATKERIASIECEMDRVRGQFQPSAVAEFADRIRKSVTDADVRNTFTSIDGLISEYRATHRTPQVTEDVWLATRDRRARALLKKAWGLESLRLLGAGGEGVVFTDERIAYKVLDLLKKRPNHDTLTTLRALRERTDDAKYLYPLSRIEVGDETLLLAYPYEPSEPYSGGHGAELIGLLRECKAYGVVFRNMHPKNLRVSATGLKLIDYGSDIRPFSEGGYRSMAERAWLTWRWPHRNDLDELMRRALNEKGLPELVGFDRFWRALNEEHPSATSVVASIVDPLVLKSGAQSVLDYGCGKQARSARRLAETGMRVVGFDTGTGLKDRWSAISEIGGHLNLTGDRDAALSSSPFDAVVCSLVLCELEDGPAYERVLSDLRRAVAASGVVLVTICNPFSTFGQPTPLHRHRELPLGVCYSESFGYNEDAETAIPRREFHRPLRRIERDLLRHGIHVERRIESSTSDLERFDPASDFMTLVCRPVVVDNADRRVSLMIKCCAMEAHTIERQVCHLVGQLERPRAFHERVLVIDSLRDGFVRQYATPDLEAIHESARRLVSHGWIDRVVCAPESGAECRRINREWFAIESESTHTTAGAALAMPLFGFESCSGDYILQVDSDLLIGRRDPAHDFLGELLSALDENPDAVCASLNVARRASLPFTAGENGQPWRVEVRGCLLHRARLLAARPLPNHVDEGGPSISWHRALDLAVHGGRVSSLRGGGNQSYFIHPPNDVKRSVADWMILVDLVEKGWLPDEQHGAVDMVKGPLAWLPRNRSEQVVLVVTGRNVSPGRMARCIESLARQSRQDWGALFIDDASSEWTREYLLMALLPWADRVTLLQPRERRGQLANTVWAVRHVCTNPESVIVTLDLDDALLGPDVVDRVLSEHARGRDVTVGSMLRTDKHTEYPVTFDNPRGSRGGNVWQHLRSFRKQLFDAIPDHDLRIGGQYVDIAVDWAFMLPIVESAQDPAWIREPLYLYEPSGLGKGADRDAREQQIGTIVSRPPRPRIDARHPTPLLTPRTLSSDVWGQAGGILFLRHGERPSFTGMSSEARDAVSLTSKGRVDAHKLGMVMRGCGDVVSSPVRRSVETAEAIAIGAGIASGQICCIDELAEFSLADKETYEAIKRRLGWAGMMAAWVDGSLPPGILMPCDEVAHRTLRAMLPTTGSPRLVAVTHDFLVIALLAALRGVRVTAVPYLSGLFVGEAEARMAIESGNLP